MGQYTFKLISEIFTETFMSGIKLMVNSHVLYSGMLNISESPNTVCKSSFHPNES
jgi:hypothetical protein